MFDKSWKKELARDTLALGGIAFYFIVIGRALIGEYYTFVWQIAIAAFLLFIFFLVFRKLELDYHIARALILVVFTILFYNDWKFSVFAVILFAVMLVCSLYVWKSKKKTFYGLVLGAIISVLSDYLVNGLGLN